MSRRNFLAGAAGATATLALPGVAAPAVKKGTTLRLWILKTYVEPTNKAIEASAQRWAGKHGGQVTVEYFTFEDMQTKYVAAIENKNTPDVGQLETGAPARFAGMGQLLDLTSFARQVEGEVGKAPANVAPVTVIGGKTYALPWYIMPAFWYVWRDVLEKAKVKLPSTFEEAKAAATAVNRPKDNFYGMGQSWNRTADGYGVMQSLMYSYGVGWAGKDGKYQSIKNPKMQQVMKWATDIYKEGIQPADTLTWTGSGNNENFIAKNIAQTSNGPSITFAMENALAKATDAKERKAREEALANHVALPHPAGPGGRRMQAICMSFGIFKNAKDPEAAMSLIAHLLSPEETVRVMNDSYGQFTPVLDKARAASKEYFNKNENYRTFGRATEWFVATGWPGPVTAAAAEVQASNVLTDAPAKVIVDKWSNEQAIEWEDKKIKEIYDTIG
ncbi:MAG TPA: extracellular solute-binding protein [Methylomirabilota bacterium]|jgi:ABC-type glycerol-3-phosphate transport system substrate-binding protein|nr:extracellular solute-binding protein [Methylomirabilota bacterium]